MPKSLSAAAAICFIVALAIWPDEAPGIILLGGMLCAMAAIAFRFLFRIEESYDGPVARVRWGRAVFVAGVVVWYVSERLHNGW